MSQDIVCRSCGQEVSEDSLRHGDHKCPGPADLIEELQNKVAELERRVEELENGQ